IISPAPSSSLFPYTTLFRSCYQACLRRLGIGYIHDIVLFNGKFSLFDIQVIVYFGYFQQTQNKLKVAVPVRLPRQLHFGYPPLVYDIDIVPVGDFVEHDSQWLVGEIKFSFGPSGEIARIHRLDLDLCMACDELLIGKQGIVVATFVYCDPPLHQCRMRIIVFLVIRHIETGAQDFDFLSRRCHDKGNFYATMICQLSYFEVSFALKLYLPWYTCSKGCWITQR